MPYALRLDLLCGGYAYFSSFSIFNSYSKDGRFEVRQPSLVEQDRFLASMSELGDNVKYIDSVESYSQWMYLRGWALVPEEFARSRMPQWLKQRSCLISPLGSFVDLEVASPGALKRSLSARQKAAVIQRDGGRCLKCGSTDNLTMQHVRPFSKGGETTSRNMVTLCFDCNQKAGVEFDLNLYESAGLMHIADPSLMKRGHVNEVSFRRALYLTKNLMVTRCEVW